MNLLVAAATAVGTTSTDIPLHPQHAADGGVRYLLNVTVDQQTLPLLAASTYDGIALRDTNYGCTAARQSCFNSSASAQFSLCPRGIDHPLEQRPVSSSITMRTTCAMDMVAMDGGVPTQTQLSILRRSSGLVMADAEFDEGLAPMADLPDFWGPAGAAGILGLGAHGPTIGNESSPWARLVAAHGGTFALDLHAEAASRSRIVLGSDGGSDSQRRIQWSSQRHPSSFLALTLYEPSVCGAAILGSASAVWPAVIDTTSSCLTLPTHAFNALAAWVAPANCTEAAPGGGSAGGSLSREVGSGASADGSGASADDRGAAPGGGSAYPAGRLASRRCFLPPGTDPSSLPVLTFRVSQHAPQLQLPLERLLLPAAAAGGERELCVRERPDGEDAASAAGGDDGASGSSSGSASSSSTTSAFDDGLRVIDLTREPPILLGTAVLASFVTHVEARPGQRRVGLEPRAPPLSKDERLARRKSTCAPRATCVGQQDYVAATNACLNPECSTFFQQLDPQTGLCSWRDSFKVMLAVVLGGFGLAELVVQQLQYQLPTSYARSIASRRGLDGSAGVPFGGDEAVEQHRG